MLLSQRRSALFALLLLLLTAVAAPRLSQAAGWGQNSKAEGVPPATPEPISDASSSVTSSSSSEATPVPAATPPPRANARETLEPRKVRLAGIFLLRKGSEDGELGISEPLFVGLTVSQPLPSFCPRQKKKKKKNHQPSQAEVYGALCLAYFAFNYFLGRRRNSRLAGEVAEALRPLLESQFSHVGAGPVPKSVGDGAAAPSRGGEAAPQLLLRESPHEFVLWASGRRNLGEAPAAGSGALLRLRLRPRQDAVSTVLAVAEGLPDQLEVTLPLPRGDGAGVPVALAVGRPAALKEAVEDFEDLRRLAKAVPPGGAPVKNLPWWPTAAAIDPDAPPAAAAAAAAGTNTGGLAAVSDSAQALADVVAAGPMGPALAASARASLAAASGRAVLAPRPRLRLLRLSGDGCLRTRGAGSPILTAVVDLPALGAGDAEGMADVARLVAAVLATADAVAVYGGRAAAGTPAGGRVMTADARSKALALRAAAAAAAAAGEDAAAGSGGEGGGGAGSSASSSAAAARKLEAKRLAAKEAEKAKLASMSSEAREKYLLKKQRIEQKRLMKRRTVRG